MREKKKKVGRMSWKNMFVSLLIAISLVALNCVLCSLALFLVRDAVIPVASLFSYELHLYMEKVEYDVQYEGVKEMIELAIFRIFAIPTLILSGPFSYYAAFGRGKKFKEETEARITYRDGMISYMREYAVYDALAVFFVVTLLWWSPFSTAFFPPAVTFYGAVHPLLGWLISLIISLFMLPFGAFVAQKRWRAQYISTALE